MLDILNSSLRLGRLFGSEVRLHSAFLAFALILVGAVFSRDGASAALWQALTMAAVFGSVLVHEFGHALAARSLGISTPKITLYPFGGIAFLDGMPRSALGELYVVIAGPMVNAAIAIGLTAGGFWNEGNVEPNTFDGFMEFLIYANIGIALFNMIPAFPMDGGRILKAMLSLVVRERIALLIAVGLGQAVAVAMLAAAVYAGAVMLVIVAVFVFLASAAEAGKHPLWLLGLGRASATDPRANP